MDEPAATEFPSARPHPPVEPFHIGPYRVIDRIGDGGMGVVYLAEQHAPIQRLVTIKCVRSDVMDIDLVRRFETERQNLARMTHPNIAQIFDAGSLPDGLPYLVMEFVRGVSLARYCFDRRVDVSGRLRLVIEICEAVQHAHQKGVMHKDLKPDNVLVTEAHGKPCVKVIDFGLSKTVRAPSGADPAATSFIGTRQYMSPEQRGHLHLDVDTRTDVYSIGVMLYELLCGFIPVDLLHAPGDAPAERLRPSTQLRQAAVDVSAARGLRSRRQLARRLHGDLDAIVLKAIARDRNARYQTPLALAEDLRRHLAGQPISLRKHDSLYVAGRMLARYRLVAATVLAALLTLSLLVGVLLEQVAATERARRAAEAASRRSSLLQELISGSFRMGSPASGPGHDLAARELLATLAADIDELLLQDPRERAALLLDAARFFYDVSEFATAERFARSALDAAGEDGAGTAPRAMLLLAEILSYQGVYPEADALLLRAQAGVAVGAPEHMLARVLQAELHNLRGAHGLAAARVTPAIDALRADRASDRRLLARALFAYAESQVHGGRLDAAIAAYDDALRTSRASHGVDAGMTRDIFAGLAYARGKRGEFAVAERMWRQELAHAERKYGPAHQKTAATLANLGSNLLDQRRWSEALQYQRRAYEAMLVFNGAGHPDTLTVLMNLATATAYAGDPAAARAQLEQVVTARRRLYGDSTLHVAYAQFALGEVLLLDGAAAAALAAIEGAHAVFAATLGQHWRTALAQLRRGQALLVLGETEAAGAVLAEGFALLDASLPETHPWRADLRADVRAACRDAGIDAATWIEALR